MEAINATSLVKRYRNMTAVDKLDLEIEQGELFSLLGVNGAKKHRHQNSFLPHIENCKTQ